MGSPFVGYLEVELLFLGAAILLFDRTRRLVIYGTSVRNISWVVGCVAAFILVGSLSNSSHLRRLNQVLNADRPLITAQKGDPLMDIVLKGEPLSFEPPPAFKPDLTTEKKERVVKGYARLVFVETGKHIDYLAANGERTKYLPSQDDIASRASKLAETSALKNEAELLLLVARVWWFAWIPVLLLGFVSARYEYSNLLRFHGFSREPKRFQSFGEIEGFAGLLMTACEQSDTYNTLETILSMSDERRQSLLRKLISDLRDKSAPKELTDALVCLMDNEVAEKVYVYIHRCRRQPEEKLAA
jgi:hypothetical protein